MFDSVTERIAELIEEPLNALGYDLIQVLISGKIRLKVRIVIDQLEGTPLTLDDCVQASRRISAIMDVEDPLESSYTLEVSSPGLDRPLTRPKDFERYVQQKINLKTFDFLEGQKRFQGILASVSSEGIFLQVDGSEKIMEIRFDAIQNARLIPVFEDNKKGKKQKKLP